MSSARIITIFGFLLAVSCDGAASAAPAVEARKLRRVIMAIRPDYPRLLRRFTPWVLTVQMADSKSMGSHDSPSPTSPIGTPCASLDPDTSQPDRAVPGDPPRCHKAPTYLSDKRQ